MTTKEIINGLQNVLDYCRYHQDAPALREAIEMLKCSEIPNSSDERTDKRTGTHACDCISRQQAIDALNEVSEHYTEKGREWHPHVDFMTFAIEELPSAQPEQTNCDYCHEDVDGFVTPLEKNCHAFIRFGMNGWELSLKANGWHGSAKIRYCPMCGRDLLVK